MAYAVVQLSLIRLACANDSHRRSKIIQITWLVMHAPQIIQPEHAGFETTTHMYPCACHSMYYLSNTGALNQNSICIPQVMLINTAKKEMSSHCQLSSFSAYLTCVNMCMNITRFNNWDINWTSSTAVWLKKNEKIVPEQKGGGG